LMVVSAFLVDNPRSDFSDDEIREAISGNLCRCTGYTNIVDAVRLAAQLMHDPERS
jgi:aerobic carbon-monoxide dehydrogenase small subunit